jgi:hypothetical protein
MIATHGAFDDIERHLIAICALAQGLLPAHVAGKHGIRKRHHFRPVLGTTVDRASFCIACAASEVAFRHRAHVTPWPPRCRCLGPACDCPMSATKQ